MKIFLSGEVRNSILNMSLLLIIGFIVTILTFLSKSKKAMDPFKTYVIEVKPKNKLDLLKKEKVTQSYLYECKTYAVNTAKWKAAREFCNDRKIEFKIITEQELGIYHGR